MRDSPFVKEHGEIISAWDSLSSNGFTHYTTLLYKDGFMTCDCPGWCIQKKDKHTGLPKPRTCTHIEKKFYVIWISNTPSSSLCRANEITKGRKPRVFITQPEQRITSAPKREGRRIDLG